MKHAKSGIALLSLAVILPLSGCQAKSRRSWWETKNLSIIKSIDSILMDRAVKDARSHAHLITHVLHSCDQVSYHKDFLGAFATETDHNSIDSQSEEIVRYENDVLVDKISKSTEISYPRARMVDTSSKDIYTIGDPAAHVIRTVEVTYHGSAEKLLSDTTGSTLTEEEYKKSLTKQIDTLIKNDVPEGTTGMTTYGLAENDELLAEQVTSAASDPYDIAFTGKRLTTITNTYRMIRLCPFKENEETHYYLDYSYERISVEVGFDLHGEPLKSPFILELTETVHKYQTDPKGKFDLKDVPSA